MPHESLSFAAPISEFRLNDLGDVLSAQGKLQKALEVYKQGLAIKKSLTDQDESDQGRLRDFALSFEKVGDVLVAQGKLQEALDVYRQTLAIAQRPMELTNMRKKELKSSRTQELKNSKSAFWWSVCLIAAFLSSRVLEFLSSPALTCN
jgi:predicted negative regulator of RcsB-dependent stress response